MGGASLILLDSHVLLWLAMDSQRLSRRAASAIRRAKSSDGIAVASITLWELALMFARGRVRGFGTAEASTRLVVEQTGAIVKQITPEIAALATQFSGDYPSDPADRLIGATARAEALLLVTRDERIRSSPLLNTLW